MQQLGETELAGIAVNADAFRRFRIEPAQELELSNAE
jgi:hypothetical protein